MKEQIYGRDERLYYWSPQDGEVCVEPRLETAALVTLWHCENDEPFRAIRRDGPLWDKVAWMFRKGKRRGVFGLIKKALKMQMEGAGPQEDIYKRDDQIFYWSTAQGEIPIRPKWDGGLGGYILLTPSAWSWRDTPNVERGDDLFFKLDRLVKNPKRTRKPKKKSKKKKSSVGRLVGRALR